LGIRYFVAMTNWLRHQRSFDDPTKLGLTQLQAVRA
jgi:hypothetical protein